MDEKELIDLLQRFAELPPQTEEGQEVARQLAGMTFAIKGLLLFSCDLNARVLAACALARVDSTKVEELLPVLVEGLRSENEAHQVYAAYACRNLGSFAEPAVSALIDVMNDQEHETAAHHAIQALEAIGHASASAVVGLVGLLDGIGPDSLGIHLAHAWAAIAALGAIGPAAQGAVPALQQCLDVDGSDDGFLRQVQLSAAEAIWQISGDTQAALRVATKMLGDDESGNRCFAAELLGNLGPVARPAIADLQRLLDDAEECVRRQAAESLRQIETPL